MDRLSENHGEYGRANPRIVFDLVLFWHVER